MPDAAATWSPATDLVARLAGTRFHDVRWFAVVDSTNRYLLRRRAARRRRDRRCGGRRRRADRGTGPPRPHLDRAAGRRAARLGAAASGASARTAPPRDAGRRGSRRPTRSATAGIDARREVAERRGRRRPEARRDPRRGRRRGRGRGRMGCNVRADAYPEELAGIATACDRHLTDGIGRDDLLCRVVDAPTTRGSTRIDTIVDVAAARSATLGRRVRVELAARDSSTGVARPTDRRGLPRRHRRRPRPW